jgi:hypothetical protein
MSNGWSFNWAGMATRERESLEMRCVESLLVVYAVGRAEGLDWQ